MSLPAAAVPVSDHARLPQPRILGPGEGDHIWFLGTLMTVKAGGDVTGGNLTVIEATMPAGFGPPLHRHDVEDELFHVLDGELTFWCAGQQATHGPGATVWLPRGLPHRFQVGDAGPARMLQITTPAQFERFALDVGEPAAAPVLPEPTPPDVEALVRISAAYQIEILPPDAA
jgi:quercetin dioxygenase-like cupin family protein